MIKTVDLEKVFVGRGQTVRAVDGVSAHVKSGEVVVIIATVITIALICVAAAAMPATSGCKSSIASCLR